MHHLYRLGFITATFIFSLISPLQVAVNPLRIKAVLAQMQTNQGSKAELGEWQKFTSTKGGFSVLMPGTPTEQN
jgi:hypothetical protein